MSNQQHKEPPRVKPEDAKFELGSIYTTPGAFDAMQGPEMFWILRRHLACDWGDCCQQDAQANDDALQHGGRIISIYHAKSGAKLWVITEADRSSTTILLPSEY